MALYSPLLPGSSMEDYAGKAPKIYGDLGVSGDSPARPILRKIQTGLGARALSQTAFGNELEPGRQSAIRRAVTLTDPGNAPALIDQFGKKAVADALEFSRIRNQALGSSGLGSGAQTGTTNAAFNHAQNATNNFAGQILSSQGQVATLRDHLAAIGLGQDPQLAMLLQQLEQMLQGSNASRDAGRKGSGIAGSLGSIAGALIGGGFGGPVGASAGGQIGGAIGGGLGY